MTGGSPSNRRRVLLALGAAVTAGLAGCSGDDPGADGDGASGGDDARGGDGDATGDGSGADAGGSGGEPSDRTTFSQPASIGDPMGSIHHNRIEAFVVLGANSFVADGHEFVPDGRFAVDVRIGNNGAEPADPDRYIFSLGLQDANGESIHSRTRVRAETEELPPGESAVVTLWDGGDEGANPDAIDAYELWIDCSVASADGIYCPEEG